MVVVVVADDDWVTDIRLGWAGLGDGPAVADCDGRDQLVGWVGRGTERG